MDNREADILQIRKYLNGELDGRAMHQLERRAMAMTALLEPAMILLMGGFVLMIVLAIMMPIMEINQFVR